MKELYEARQEDLGKLAYKLIKNIEANSKEKVNRLKAQHFTGPVGTSQRRRWRPEQKQLQGNEQVQREVRRSIVCNTRYKASRRDELFMEALRASLIH